MITSSVHRGAENDDAKFPWVLVVRGVPIECRDIRWEQFVSGGFNIDFSDGTSRYYSAGTTMQRVNPRARQFGSWSDDLLPDMTPGPRSVGDYRSASCGVGILRPLTNPRSTMRIPLVDPRGATYRFEDAPGFSMNFGDTIANKTFVGIGWNVRFEHKLWRQGDSRPLHRSLFTLTGRYDQSGSDTRRIILA